MNKLIGCILPYWLVLLSAFLVVSSCTKDSMPKLVLEEKESSNPYRISEQEALASLQDFLNSPTGYSPSPTKSGPVNDRLRGKKIGKVNYLTASSSFRTFLSSKTAHSLRTKIHEIDPGGPLPDSIIIPDTLVYVVNFDDDGFAVLSADSRISSTIIAVVESGSISIENFNLNDYLEQMFSDTTLTYDDYSWGVDEDGDDITWEDSLGCSSYDEELFDLEMQQDTLTPQQVIIELISEYVINEIIEPHSPGNGIDPGEQWQNPESGQSGQEGGGQSGNQGGQGSSGGNSGGGGNFATYEWVTISEVSPMLSTQWFQDAPLNQFCPMKKGERTLIGCGAVAMGQILAYHEYPQNLFLNGYYCDWNLLKSVYCFSNMYPDGNSSAVKHLSHFLHEVGVFCEMNFWAGGSNTTALKCKKVLKAAGYSNVHRHIGYHGNTIISMLDNGNPVFIGANPKFKRIGHYWVIDGYKIQSLLDSSGSSCGSRTVMHCNWGWGGNYDGYYTSGIFNPGGSHYNWAYRMVTYNNPNSN